MKGYRHQTHKKRKFWRGKYLVSAIYRNFTKTNVLYFIQHFLLYMGFELQIKQRCYGFCRTNSRGLHVVITNYRISKIWSSGVFTSSFAKLGKLLWKLNENTHTHSHTHTHIHTYSVLISQACYFLLKTKIWRSVGNLSVAQRFCFSSLMMVGETSLKRR